MSALSVYKYTVKFAWNDIISRKVRAGLTILGITVGVAALVALMSITLGMQTQIENMLSETLGLAVTLSGKTGIEVPVSLIPAIMKINGVINAYPVIEQTALVGSAQQPAILEGIEPKNLKDALPNMELKDGRLFHENEEGVLITANLADRLGIKIGDTIEVSPTSTGATSKRFRVVGIIDIGLSLREMGFIVMPLSQAQELYNRPSYASSIVIKVASRDLIHPLAEALKRMFPEARIIEPEQIARQINRIMNVINATLLSISSISLIVAALSVMNTITMVVRERIREIGILKAIGAQRLHILAIFLSEAFLLSFIGGLVGVVVGLAGAHIVTSGLIKFMGMQLTPVMDPIIMLEGLTIASAVGVVAGFQPAWKGANIRPIEALRYE